MPCGLSVDMERARFARRGVGEMLNSRGEWETAARAATETTLGEAMAGDGRRAGVPPSRSRARSTIGFGNLCRLARRSGERYGREAVLGTRRVTPCSRSPRGCAGFSARPASIPPRSSAR